MAKKPGNKVLVLVSFVLYAAMVVLNALAATGYINGTSQKMVSASFPTQITPAGYAFIIWSVIYLLLLVSLVISFFKSKDGLHSNVIQKTGIYFWISCVANIAWTFVFSFKIMWASVIFILVLLVSLLLILNELRKLNGKTKTVFDFAIGIYAGWLFVASLVNIAAFFVSINVQVFENQAALYPIILAIAIVGAVLLNWVHQNPLFYLAIAWAFVAILSAIGFKNYLSPLSIVLEVGVVVLVAVAVWGFTRIKVKL